MIDDRPLAMQAKKGKQSQEDHTHINQNGVIIRGHKMKPGEIVDVIEKLEKPTCIIQETERTRKRVVDGYPYEYSEYLLEKDYNYELEIKEESSSKETANGENLAAGSQKELSSKNLSKETHIVNDNDLSKNDEMRHSFSLPLTESNTDSAQRFINALNEDDPDNIAVFYINKEKATQYLQPTGHPISSTAQIPDGFIHSVTDAGSNVNMRISHTTESRQFINWFGDWRKKTQEASKVVNIDGTKRKS